MTHCDFTDERILLKFDLRVEGGKALPAQLDFSGTPPVPEIVRGGIRPDTAGGGGHDNRPGGAP